MNDMSELGKSLNNKMKNRYIPQNVKSNLEKYIYLYDTYLSDDELLRLFANDLGYELSEDIPSQESFYWMMEDIINSYEQEENGFE